MTFEEIGRVNGNGNSSQMHDYSFIDFTPSSGSNYYRLKQTDYDGRYEHLGIVVVDVIMNSAGCVLSVFPNPCQGTCTVNFSDCPDDNTGYISLEMIDANGQVVSQVIPERNSEGGFSTTIDATNNLKPGVYIVRASSSKTVYAQKAVIK